MFDEAPEEHGPAGTRCRDPLHGLTVVCGMTRVL